MHEHEIIYTNKIAKVIIKTFKKFWFKKYFLRDSINWTH